MLNKNSINYLLRFFHLEMHGVGFMQSLRKHGSPPDPFSVQSEIIKNPKTIFDIGANRGDISEKYLSIYPDVTIYAFEPFPDLFMSLKKRFKTGNINCFQLAISKLNESLKFYTNQNPDTNSLLKPQKIGLNSDKQAANIGFIEVNSVSLDSFCLANNIKEIDILKLDIQGGELDALLGANTLLSNKSIKLIYTETYFKKQYENQALFHDISKHLEKHDYFLQDIYNPIYGKGSIAWCDAIFLPK